MPLLLGRIPHLGNDHATLYYYTNDHTVFESLFVSTDCRHSLLTQVTGNDDMYMVHMATAQGQGGSLVIVNISD